jgi:Dolichyl-phosphate-mannose-protein mannosyltransferase
MINAKLGFWLCDVTLILSICFLLFFYRLGAAPFFDKQEAREALVVWEINRTGNWILPLRNGDEIPAKPPLFHWLGALVSKSINRVDELTTRFPSALFGTLGVLLTYMAGVTLWGRSAGLVSALVLSTSFEWLRVSTTARVDMTLTFALFCSFLFFLYLYRTGGGRKKALVFGVLLSLATLAKGPLGFIVPCLTVFVFLWARRDLLFLKKLHPLAVISAWLIVAGSWYTLALWEGGKDFLLIVVRENFSSVIGEEAGHPHPFYWYLPILFQNMTPWSFFLLSVGAFIYYRRGIAEEAILYVVVWFLTVLIFFSAFTQKRPVYIAPLYPALALLIGAWWQKLKDESASSPPLFLARLAGYLNAVLFFLFSGVLFFQVIDPDLIKYILPFLRPKDQAQLQVVANLFTEHQLAVSLWSALCGLGGIVLAVATRQGAWEAIIAYSAAVMVTSFFFVQNFNIYVAREYSFKPFAERALHVVNDAPLFFYRSGDYGVIFYAHRHIPRYSKSLVGEKSFYLLLWEREWKEMPDKERLTVEYASEMADRQSPERGRLFLVAVKKAEALGNLLESDPGKFTPRQRLSPSQIGED